MDLHKARLDVVRRKLVQAGIDSRRITDEFRDDGTASVKIRVIRDVNVDMRLPSSRAIAEAPAGDFLGDLLKGLHATLGRPEYQEVQAIFRGCHAVSVLYYPPKLKLSWASEKGLVRLLAGNLDDPQFQKQLQALDARKYLPYACLYSDTARFPQFQIPPSGLLLKRLPAYATIQKLAPTDFAIDSQIGDSTGQGSHFTDQSWTVSPTSAESPSLQVVLVDGTHLSVPITVEEQWTYRIKKLWTVIVALAGVGVFGGLAKLFGFFKDAPKPSEEIKP